MGEWEPEAVLGPGRALIEEGGATPGTRRTWFTRDGGRTWERKWTTGPVVEPRTLQGLPVPGPAGRALIAAEDREHMSVDGGRSFRPSGEGTSFTRRTPIGLLRSGAACAYAISVDGERWSEFALACESENP